MTGALLPEGFHDRLPPGAEAAAHVLRAILDSCAAHGYDRVQPPLVEYEAGLALWLGKSPGAGLLRSSDPASGAGLAFRPDITGQIARIAATRLASVPRPLRLAYAGQVLRARGSQIDPARERTQAGAELIGADSVVAVAEVLKMAVEALTAAGVTGISVDLTLPELVPALAAGPWPVADASAVATALDAKDAGRLAELGALQYRPLLDAAGPAGTALPALKALRIETSLFDQLAELVNCLDGVRVTVDPTERHGFEYQSWIGFSLFGEVNGQPVRGEIGRGGSYRVRHPDGQDEPACGFSVYLDGLVDAGLGVHDVRRVFLPFGTPGETGIRLRAEGWATVAGLSPEDSGNGISNIWDGASIISRN
ncbi:MAG: ATP phosphoribosyltransferase regulatory subunit [Sphingomonadaceae bacterium]